MSCRQPGEASQARKCSSCDADLEGQVGMNLHHAVTVAMGGLGVVERELTPVDPKKCVHVRAVCKNGHANLFFVDPNR